VLLHPFRDSVLEPVRFSVDLMPGHPEYVRKKPLDETVPAKHFVSQRSPKRSKPDGTVAIPF
jgi:hypothetical protein